VVDQHLDVRVRLDVAQALQRARAFGLLVDGGIERVAVEREADRDDVGTSLRVDGGQPGDTRIV
jgi:hypothetical protein